MRRLRTDAWLLRGISTVPGELILQGQLLSFVVSGTGSAWPWQLRTLERDLAVSGLAASVEAGELTQAFKWSVPDLRVSVPWYYFSSGINVEHLGCRLRFSFGAPARNGRSPGDMVANLREVRTMRARGRLWLAALREAATVPNTDGRRAPD